MVTLGDVIVTSGPSPILAAGSCPIEKGTNVLFSQAKPALIDVDNRKGECG